MATARINVTPSKLKTDATLKQLVVAIVETHGFKWDENGGTDLCPAGTFQATIKGSNIEAVFTDSPNLVKSSATFSKIDIPRDLENEYVFVHVKGAVSHVEKEKVAQPSGDNGCTLM